jgi:hypothetical protein
MVKGKTMAAAAVLACLLGLGGQAEAGRSEKLLVSLGDLGKAGVIWSADMAYDAQNNRMLIVWVNNDRIRGQFFRIVKSTKTIAALTPASFPISLGSGHYFVRTAYGAGKFIVSYGVSMGAGTGVVREVRVVDYDGAGAPVVVPAPASRGEKVDTGTARGSGGVAYVPGSASPTHGNHFVVTWVKEGRSFAQVVFPDGSVLGSPPVPLTVTHPCNLAVPEVAVNPRTGRAMIVGYRDPTSTECSGQSGLWYRYLDQAGDPSANMRYVVEGADVKGLHREQKVAFGDGRFQVAWNRKSDTAKGIYGRGFSDTAALDAAKALKLAVGGGPVWDNAFGQVGIGYDAASGRYLLSMRGADPGDGKAAVWQIEVGKAGAPVAGSFDRLTPNLAPSPNPVVATDGTGYKVVIYRSGYSKISGVLIYP